MEIGKYKLENGYRKLKIESLILENRHRKFDIGNWIYLVKWKLKIEID